MKSQKNNVNKTAKINSRLNSPEGVQTVSSPTSPTFNTQESSESTIASQTVPSRGVLSPSSNASVQNGLGSVPNSPAVYSVSKPIHQVATPTSSAGSGNKRQRTKKNTSYQDGASLNPDVQRVLGPSKHAHSNEKVAMYLPSTDRESRTKPIPPAHIQKKVEAPPHMFPPPNMYPAGPVTHSILYTASQTGKPSVSFLNPAPIPRNVFATHIVYNEAPFIKQVTPMTEIEQMKRCISLGKANMNLNLVTPPPAHCNPGKPVAIIPGNNGKKRPYHLPVQKVYNSASQPGGQTQRFSGPSQPKKPRLVSDYLFLNAPPPPTKKKTAYTSVPKKAMQNAPPKNPFVNSRNHTIIESGPPPTVISSGGVGAVVGVERHLVNDSNLVRMQQVIPQQQQQTAYHQGRQQLLPPGCGNNTAVGGKPLSNIHNKPLSVQVPMKSVQTAGGGKDSPIVISPPTLSTSAARGAGGEPVNLCVGTGDGIMVNAMELLSKINPLQQHPGTIIPFIAMQQNNVVNPSSMIPITRHSNNNSIMSVAASDASVATSVTNIANAVIRPSVAIPNNAVAPSKTPLMSLDSNKVQIKQVI